MQWTLRSLERFAPEHSEESLFESLLWVCRELGYEYCSINIFVRLPLGQNKVYKHNNYPDAWKRCYQENRYFEHDPLVQDIADAQLPLLWGNELFAGHLELWRQYQAHGLRYGISQVVHSGRGVSSVLSLVRSQDEISIGEFYDKAGDVLWLANLVHNALAIRIDTAVQQQLADSAAEAGLSPREREVLKWTAQGLTSVDVAKVLQLSERTVNFHIARCIEKLGVCNKLSAVVRAVLCGLI
ncbi:autoinducer binding domain-containing protein [Pseudomonas sp.]|uniref:autoinducer binding domain-containing protein n=1 Tax=Pseudomonas sp. TaxID=306 RepID=UPI003CC6300A